MKFIDVLEVKLNYKNGENVTKYSCEIGFAFFGNLLPEKSCARSSLSSGKSISIKFDNSLL